jgi:uncharacterized membrane protein YfcA
MLQYILLFVVGIAVGAMNAVAGGGMLLGFPVLLATGMPALVANATANIIVLPGQFASAYGYRRYLRTIPRSYLLLLIPCAVGAAIGAIILRNTSYGSFAHLVPWLIVFAVVLFALQPYLHFHLKRHMNRPQTAKKPPKWLAACIIPLSIYGGYFGAGLGFVMLAFLGFTNLKDIHKMNALKNLLAAMIAITSIACLFSTHLIDWHKGFAMGGGNLLGGYFGAVLSQRIPSNAIRIVVITIGIITAGYLVVHSH